MTSTPIGPFFISTNTGILAWPEEEEGGGGLTSMSWRCFVNIRSEMGAAEDCESVRRK